MASASSTPWAAAGLALALLAAGSTGCEQSDDVVANLSALSDGGGLLGGAAAPMPVPDAGTPACETSQIYVLLSSIVRNQCRVPSSAATLAVLGAFFVQNPPANVSGEERPVSLCDLFGGRFTWFYEQTPGAGDYVLCPAHCEVAAQYVVAEDQRVLECQGLGGG